MKGADAEDFALAHLEAQGLRLIDRNVRVPGGEIDLLMRHHECLVVVEVRKRSNTGFGTATESIDARKRSRLIHATRMMLGRRPQFADMPIRFDVVALDAQNHIEWLQAAFEAE